MYILFEEEGSFRAGTVMADNTTSLQVELPTGKRSKVKATHVLLRFAAPGPSELMSRAEADAAAMESEFLWETCPDHEFGFDEMAADYYGHPPTPVEAAALLLSLHAAPIYFHRKGRGRFRKAPADILQAALAGLEKKKQQALAVEQMAASLVQGILPDELRAILPQLLYQPDRNRLETKALEAACSQAGQSPIRLLASCGALPDSHALHLGRFLFEYFPQGTAFPDGGLPTADPELPVAPVQAFSIDDAATTEIDDAFSVTPGEDGRWTVGIHIAAPGLGIAPESPLGKVARSRLSTVYMPGRKITMLPDAIVERYTLAEGRTVPALSLYLDVASDFRILGHESRIERVPIAANLRHHDLEPVFNDRTLAEGLSDFPYAEPLRRLWELATVLEAGRGKASQTQRKEYGFSVDWTQDSPQGPGRVSIVERPRGSPLDTLVAELMIVANATWGQLLADAGVPGLYRAQSSGKVRMTTVAAPHEGLGVACYAWSSSPLRRYADLVNQWQLLACLRGEPAPFPPKSADLLAALRDFELTYAAYADFQRAMERYWCLRYLLQEEIAAVTATVVRDNWVRLDDLPLSFKLSSLPPCVPGTPIRVAIDGIDLIDAEGQFRFLEMLASAPPDTAFPEEEGGEGGE